MDANESAQDLRQSSKLRASKQQLIVCASKVCPDVVRADCVERLAEIDKALPTIVFEVKNGKGEDVADASVTMDGVPLVDRLDGSALAIDPGTHRFAIRAGSAVVEKELVIREGEHARRESITFVDATSSGAPDAHPSWPPLAPYPAPPEQADHRTRLPMYAAFGAGAVGLALGVTFTSMWASAKSSGDTTCGKSGSCTPTQTSDFESRQRLDSTLAIVSYIAAAGGAGVGTWLALREPSPSKAQVGHVRAWIGLGWAGAYGWF